MKKPAAVAVSTAALAVAVLNGGTVMAQGGSSSGTWPTSLPLPTDPGTLVWQSPTRAVVRSTESVAVVRGRLDELYVTQKGCTLEPAVNKPKDYFCYNAATRKTDEVFFTFAALDPSAADPSVSQSNAFYVQG
jgi:hypothetical protein